MRTRIRRDAGETLLETLIALIIIGVAVAAILGGVAASSTLSFDHRELVTSDVAVKAAAESLKKATYIPNACPSTDTTCVAGKYYPMPSVPSGYSVSITSVLCWPAGAGPSWDVSTFPSCKAPGIDNGLQVLQVLVTPSDGRVSDKTQVMKRQ